jgi:putative pyruvate formate lyase activating enzyme
LYPVCLTLLTARSYTSIHRTLTMHEFKQSYINLYESGELKNRADLSKKILFSCTICPRECGVNRFESNTGFCHSGQLAEISSYCDHHGEEPAISGNHGSGTIFFSHCNLRCNYCQNHQISQGDAPSETVDGKTLAGIMMKIQDEYHCHNINLVSPSHYVAQIIEAVYYAVPMGLKLPIVYNTNAFDSLSTLKLLDGIIDIYLPDIKYASNEYAEKYSHCNQYVEISRSAILEMYKQVGNLIIDEKGLAKKGLIVRHLILPNGIAGSRESLQWIAKNLTCDTTVSIMSQYYPSHQAIVDPVMARKVNSDEYNEVVNTAEELGFENGWFQQLDSAENYLPDFQQDGHPFHSR